jgi:transglutaminase-like putative cysteine protease
MKTPPFLMAAALLLWGWQTGHLFWGIGMGALLESSRLSRRRWEFSDDDLKHIWFLSLALQAGAGLILFSTEDRMLFVFKFAQTFPLSLLPLMLAQAYGSGGDMPLTVFAWPLPKAGRTNASRAINVSYVYFALCVVGTSASTRANAYFYPGMTLLIMAALTWARPHRVGRLSWLMLGVTVVVAGFFAQQELRRLQGALETALGGFIADMFHQPADARECRTQIGQMVQLPLSGRIVWRVTPDSSGFAPGLLCQSVFNGYRNETWSCSSNDYVPASSHRAETFDLVPAKQIEFDVQIAGYYDNGEGPVALPHGAFELKNVASPARALTNRLGCVELNNAPGLVVCTARWGPGASLDPPPEPLDLSVTENERPVLARIVEDLGLKNLSERQKIRAIEKFFSDHFTYSLTANNRRQTGKTPLGVFLTETRSGHCEYFATATVLMLRQAGIPARYAIGYAAPESARQGKTYLLRERDAHAWALAYHDDTRTWEEVDTTPSSWTGQPAAQPPWWESVSDLGSNLYFRFSEWRWSKTSLARYASWLMVPLILSLAWRIIANQQRRAAKRVSDAQQTPPWPGLDSELYQIDRQLADANLSRLPGETLAFWQRRLETTDMLPQPDRLKRIFDLHRTLRFDPQGLTSPQRRALKEEAERWLADFAGQNPKAKTRRLLAGRSS